MIELKECVEILDSKRIPLSALERKRLKKIYPYYGAQVIIDYVENYIFDGEYILIAEDGNNLKSLQQNIATWVEGKFWVNNHAHILGEKKGYNLRYIYYLLSILDLRGYITGSAQPKLNQENLASIQLQLPNINRQNKVAQILSCIDNKIAINNKINSELETMGKVIYDYWFLQFEFPNEKGKPYKSSGGKMIWNEKMKREIPEGWKAIKLQDVFSFVKGKTPSITFDNSMEGAYPYITIDVANGGKSQYCFLDDMPVCNGEVIMVMDGAASGDIYIGNRGVLGSTFAMLKKKSEDISDALIYVILSSRKNVYKKVNTGSTVPHANKKFIENMRVPVADNMSSFSRVFDEIYKKIELTKRENQELISLREFLLPLLMNGQVSFKE